jgi:hypothetical protein
MVMVVESIVVMVLGMIEVETEVLVIKFLVAIAKPSESTKKQASLLQLSPHGWTSYTWGLFYERLPIRPS